MADKLYDAYNQEIELTSEQEACLKYTGKRTLMVKGYAGAGKSLVLMAIAQKYVEKYGADAKNKVAIFTFQNTLVSTTREFLHVNGGNEDGIVVSTINSFTKAIYDQLVKEKKAPKRSYPMNTKAGNEQRLKNVDKALKAHRAKEGKHRFHDLPLDFWLEEFDWMKDMNVWKNDEIYYLSLKRTGRGGKVRMGDADRKVAYQIFLSYCDYLEKTEQGDWADQTLYLVRNADLIPERMKFEHVLIDEAQDLSMAQMTAVMCLYKTDMIVAMDMNQKIHDKHWTPKQLGIESTTKKLTKSMRTTKQIDALAESVRSKNDINLSEDDISLRAIPERDGAIPKLVHLDDQASERKYVINLVNAYRKSNPNLTIGIIAAKKTQIGVYSDWLASENIPHEQVTKDTKFSMAKPGVKVVSAFGAKGLEFNCVIIPMFAEGYFPYNFSSDDEEEMEQYLIKMRNLVYVSMTRAKNLLTITWWGNKGSRFIADMDKELYQVEGSEFEIMPVSNTPKVKKTPVESGSGTKEEVKLPHEKVSPTSTSDSKSSLYDYLSKLGLEVLDKREKGGALWLVGGKELDPIVKETRKLFGALWTFSEKGGTATKHKPGWYTKSPK